MHTKEAPLVLLVEDDQDTREMYSEYLSYSGLRVAEAPTGFRVTDIAMPGMDGLELSRRLRADPPTRDVPIIAVTGNPTPTERARAAGCDMMLEKPCMPDELLHAIEDVLDKSRE